MWAQVCRNSGLKEPCGRLKAFFFSTPTRYSWKQPLPKHKHHFESLFEYKSDDEDDSGTDADSLEDGLDQPPAKRTGHSDKDLAKENLLRMRES